MRYNDVYKRLFIIYTCVLLLCVGSLDAYFIYYSKENIKEQRLYLNKKMIEDIELELIKNTNSAERILNGIYNQNFIAMDLISLLNNDLTSYLEKKLDYLAQSELEFYNGIERYVTQTFSAYKEIINIEFVSYTRQEVLKFNTNSRLTKDLLDRSTVEKLQNQKILSGKNKISYIKEIRNPSDLKKEGLMIITYSTDIIEELVQSYGDDAIIVDQYGQVVYDSDSDYGQQKLLDSIDKLSIVDKINLGDGSYYTNLIVDKLGNRILGRVDSVKATYLPISYYLTLLLMDILVISITVFIIHIKLKKLSERMNKIVQGMEQLKAGNLDVKIELTGQKDELNFIAEQFNNMCIDLKNYIDISYLAEINKTEAELSQKKAEMSALQSKINPHFLYNTLEAIRMKAISSGNREVGRMLYLLGNLFRSQLKEDDIITIDKEIKYCKEYLELFKYRYDEKFNYHIQCEEELYEKKIIKFVLQPLVENYIVHGMRREDYDNELSVYVFRKAKDIRIVIQDNGKGIQKEKIESINKKLREKDFSGKSIGIVNTHERITLQYGDNYGVKIDESFEDGTRIILDIPMRGE